MSNNSTYKAAGVDIEAGDETVKRIKGFAKSTFNKNVLSDIGLFGAFYQPDLKGLNEPVLVSSVDGVGTKLKVAFAADRHDTVGQDLVNHCVNDISVCGAKPLYFLDYLAFGKLVPDKAAKIIEGFSVACRENECALIGGETAEMPGLYSEDEYDMSGTIVGIVDKSRIVDGRHIKKGDILIGFPSNGLHTNGYSLARQVLFQKFKIGTRIDELGSTLGDELLRIHKSYLRLITHLKDNMHIKGFSHITGGGIVGNTKRIIPGGLKLNIEWDTWELPAIFRLIQQTGKISFEEMRNVFNLGIGLVAVVAPDDENKINSLSNEINEHPVKIGEVI
ncbi:MAG TPA: phosphoribosylformylglycinamidine cyclo-ligase [Ignavibacteriaceae bacterium]|nr:phosphoribosylformylglycinamidine cyclo-ligase [Ignavibacteriaceae bacterium]